MTITTSTSARRSSSAPRVSFRRGIIMGDSRGEKREAPRSTWIGSLVVPR